MAEIATAAGRCSRRRLRLKYRLPKAAGISADRAVVCRIFACGALLALLIKIASRAASTAPVGSAVMDA